MPESNPLHRQRRVVRVCRICSTLEGVGPRPEDDPCTREHDWIERPLTERLGVDSRVIQPHPDGGWPEIRIAHSYIVHSDDPAVVEAERARLMREASDA